MEIIGWIIFALFCIWLMRFGLNSRTVSKINKDPILRKKLDIDLMKNMACYSDYESFRASALKWLEENALEEAEKIKKGNLPKRMLELVFH